MTVCIAAISHGNTIFCAADRMITAGDTEFEPTEPKIIEITNAIYALTAGDSSIQSEVLQNVYAIVGARIRERQEDWWSVREVAELWIDYYNLAKSSRAEATILAPLRLTNDTFISRQSQMNEVFVESIRDSLITFPIPAVGAIITGLDLTGPHIYVVGNERGPIDIRCCDTDGFAAIGLGARHAESQFMFAGHSRKSPLLNTMLLTYIAKKRAEAAPGVGAATDMIQIGPALGQSEQVIPQMIKVFDELFQDWIINRDRSMLKEANTRLQAFVDAIEKKTGKPQHQEVEGEAVVRDGRQSQTNSENK